MQNPERRPKNRLWSEKATHAISSNERGEQPPPTVMVERTRRSELMPGLERKSGAAVRLHRSG
jgi:hypothetical protein